MKNYLKGLFSITENHKDTITCLSMASFQKFESGNIPLKISNQRAIDRSLENVYVYDL